MSTLNLDRSLQLPQDVWQLLERYQFDLAAFQKLRSRLRNGQLNENSNRLQTPMRPPLAGDIVPLPAPRTPGRAEFETAGKAAIARGELAVVILAGGMATRFGGVVKASVEVAAGRSFLDLKLMDIRDVAVHCAASIPVYLMTSFATDAATRALLPPLNFPSMAVDTFPQFISLRLQPNGELFRDGQGRPSPYAPGHGDFSSALARSGKLEFLLDSGVKYVFLTNIDNLAATLEPALLGMHIAQKKQMSFEVVVSQTGDVGGTPARVDGVLQVVEGMREPVDFDRRSIPLFSTNCLWFNLEALAQSFPLDWFVVTKKVDGQTAVQFERFVNQLTAFMPACGLLVERTGPDARFTPVKDPSELGQARDVIVSRLRARGLEI